MMSAPADCGHHAATASSSPQITAQKAPGLPTGARLPPFHFRLDIRRQTPESEKVGVIAPLLDLLAPGSRRTAAIAAGRSPQSLGRGGTENTATTAAGIARQRLREHGTRINV